MSSQEFWFHIADLALMIFGVAIPFFISSFRLWSVFKDYPPHRHINGSIIYPRDYEPTQVERSKS